MTEPEINPAAIAAVRDNIRDLPCEWINTGSEGPRCLAVYCRCACIARAVLAASGLVDEIAQLRADLVVVRGSNSDMVRVACAADDRLKVAEQRVAALEAIVSQAAAALRLAKADMFTIAQPMVPTSTAYGATEEALAVIAANRLSYPPPQAAPAPERASPRLRYIAVETVLTDDELRDFLGNAAQIGDAPAPERDGWRPIGIAPPVLHPTGSEWFAKELSHLGVPAPWRPGDEVVGEIVADDGEAILQIGQVRAQPDGDDQSRIALMILLAVNTFAGFKAEAEPAPPRETPT